MPNTRTCYQHSRKPPLFVRSRQSRDWKNPLADIFPKNKKQRRRECEGHPARGKRFYNMGVACKAGFDNLKNNDATS